MRNQDRRLDKLSANLPAKERALAIMDAVRRDDIESVMSLQASTPRKSYSQADAVVVDAVQAVEIVSLRFDRAFYMLMMGLYASLQTDNNDKDMRENVARIIRELGGLVAGADLFAKCVGLSRERLLSFSMVMDGDWIEFFAMEPDDLSDEQLALAEEFRSAMEKLWGHYAGQSPFTVAA